jgi:hypothetical protein
MGPPPPSSSAAEKNGPPTINALGAVFIDKFRNLEYTFPSRTSRATRLVRGSGDVRRKDRGRGQEDAKRQGVSHNL